MKFNNRTISRTLDRQCRRNGKGALCAMRGEDIWSIKTFMNENIVGGWYPVPRNPKGSNTINNCVILCPKCYSEVKEQGFKEIPYSKLPYFKGD